MTYIAIDFETTGLDTKKDEPIQIGIVACDDNFGKIKKYVSYIKPLNHLGELKNIVGLITGLKIQDVENAKNPSVVFLEVEKFISQFENPIFIGHSVDFDLKFLKKGITNLGKTQLEYIDTYPMAQTFLHFMGSYALETITSFLMNNEIFKKIFDNILNEVYSKKIKSDNIQDGKESFHDALYDSVLSLVLFQFLLGKKEEIDKKYGNYIELKNEIKNIFIQKTSKKDFFKLKNINTSLPLLIKPLKNTKKRLFSHNIENFPNNFNVFKNGQRIEKYNTENINLQSFLEEIYLTEKKTIIAVSHPNKLNIIKTILKDKGIPFSFLFQDQIINPENMKLFLSKPEFCQEELFFIYKYFSQLEEGYSLIDVNNSYFKKIMYFLQKKLDGIQENIVLTSHYGLYNFIKTLKKDFSDYQIAFLDTKRRYSSFNKFINQEIDFYYLLEKIEFLKYKYSILKEHYKNYHINYNLITKLLGSFSVFVGVFYIEATKLASENKKNKIIVYDFFNNQNFYKSSGIWERLRILFKEIQKTISKKDIEEILKVFQKISTILNDNFKIQTKIFGHTGLYYTIQNEINYVDFAEFLSVFNDKKIAFFETNGGGIKLINNKIQFNENNKEKTSKKDFFIDKNQKPQYLEILSISKIIQYLEKNTKNKVSKNIFIVSNNKEMSKKLLFELKTIGFNKNYQLLGENITGGVKKNISKAMEKGSKIIIGGYNFFLGLQEKKVFLDNIIFFQVSGSLKDTIIADMKWWII